MRPGFRIFTLVTSLFVAGASLPGCTSEPADAGAGNKMSGPSGGAMDKDRMEGGNMTGATDQDKMAGGAMDKGKMDGAMDKGKMDGAMDKGKMDGAMDKGKMESGSK